MPCQDQRPRATSKPYPSCPRSPLQEVLTEQKMTPCPRLRHSGAVGLNSGYGVFIGRRKELQELLDSYAPGEYPPLRSCRCASRNINWLTHG